MKLLTLFTVCLMLMFSCQKKENETTLNLPKIVKEPYDTIIQLNVKEMQSVDLYVYDINFNTQSDFSNKRNLSNKDYEFRSTTNPLRDSLLVIVDDKINKNFHSSQITSKERLSVPQPLSEENNYHDLDSVFKVYRDGYNTFISERQRKHYNTFPLFVYNSSNNERLIEHNSLKGEIFAITEAKDSNDIWQPIEFIEYTKSCGNGKLFKLQPKQFLVTAIPKYDGDFETKLRVKFYSFGHIYYSNVFEGSINLEQFNKSKVVERLKFQYGSNTEQYEAKLKFIFLNY